MSWSYKDESEQQHGRQIGRAREEATTKSYASWCKPQGVFSLVVPFAGYNGTNLQKGMDNKVVPERDPAGGNAAGESSTSGAANDSNGGVGQSSRVVPQRTSP